MNSSTNNSAPMSPVFEGDRAAWAVLKDNFTDTRGVIRPKLGHTPTEREFQAVDYLCGEWDYGYEPPHDSGVPVSAAAPKSGETPDQRPADGAQQ